MSKTISATRALKAETLWFQAQEILVWLSLGYMPEFARPTQGFSGSKIVKDPAAMPAPVGWVEIDDVHLRRLQATLNTIFKLMAKVLPDLKAIELNDITEATSATRDPVALARQVRGMLALDQASRVAPTSTRVQ